MTAKRKYVKLKRFNVLKVMGMVRSLTLIFILFAQVSSLHAGSVQSVLKHREQSQLVYPSQVLPPPEKLFDTAFGLSRFYEAVREGHCGGALLDIASAFHKRHPDLPHPHKEGLLAWNDILAPRNYPELFFCRTMQHLDEHNREIKEKAISGIFRFSQFEKPLDPNILPGSPLGRRASSAGDLFRLALFNYAPAQVALAALSEKGDVVRLTPAYAYYLLSRAKHLGYKASDLAPLLKKATAALSADERQQLTARIKSGDWPREERRVVD